MAGDQPLEGHLSAEGKRAKIAPARRKKHHGTAYRWVAAYLPILLPATRLHVGLILTVVVGILLSVLLRRTTWGFRIRVVGRSPLVAQASGIKVNAVLVSALVASGMLAGLAGFCEAAGVQHRMIEQSKLVEGAELIPFPELSRFLHMEESRAVMRRMTDFFLPEPE